MRAAAAMMIAAIGILACQALVGCVTVEAYRVTGGIGKISQDYEDLQPGPAGGAAQADPAGATGTVATSTSGSAGTINVVTGSDNTQAADKTAPVNVDAKPGLNARDVTAPVGPRGGGG